MFATQEIVAKYLREGSRVYMCLYDLQKAFDSVEYLVLLEKPYDVGVNGKMWRLLKSLYEGGSCQVKLDGRLSDSYHVERGVKQGSVLSPALYGSIGVFQGDTSPLSSREVIESCVMPVLLYGSENWILTEALLKKLEAFQGSWF